VYSLLLSTFFLVPAEISRGGAPELSLREVRSYEVEDFDHPSLRGLRFPPDSGLFSSLEVRPTTLRETSRPFLSIVPRRQLGELSSKVLLAEPMNVAFDGVNDRLYLLEATSQELLELWERPEGGTEVARLSASELGIGDPRGIAVGAGGESLFVFDRGEQLVVGLDLRPDSQGSAPLHLGEHRVSTVSLEAQGLPELAGLAHDSGSGHFLILESSLQVLQEFSASGRWVRSHDLSGLKLIAPVRLLVAPSADLTDDPSVLHLYLADGGPEGEVSESRIREFSLSAPARVPLPAAAMETATLVQTIDTSAFDPSSPDPAGITYLPSMNTLLVSDSEVNEMSIYEGANVFEVSLGGSLLDTATTDPPSNEPTGIVYVPGPNASGGEGTVYISDDTGNIGIYCVDLGLDGLFGTGDDVWTGFSTGAFGAGDAEGITYDSTQGVLYLADGVNSEVYRIDPGQNPLFDCSPSQVTSWDTAGFVTDPEGIAFDEVTGNLVLAGRPRNRLWEVTTSGALVAEIDISAANEDKPAGLTVAPSSQNALLKNIYVVDRGVDNNSNPNENDGKIYEFARPNNNAPPTANNDSATTPENTSITIDVAANDVDPEGSLDLSSTNTGCGTCSGPSNGTLVNNGDGTFDYTPNPSFGGPDSFVYEICDTGGLCDTALATIQVGNPPTANDDSAATLEETLVTIDVAANDVDPEGSLDPTSANTSCATCSGPSNGTLTNNGNGTFDYTPGTDFSGGDSFVYEICDATLLCDTATVTITVSPVNDPPVANDDPVSTAEDTLITINVASNDTDADGNLDPATANTTCGTCSGPSNGTLVNNGDGTFDYTPDPGFSTTDSFVYEICDTAAACDTAAVAITVGLPTVLDIRVEANSDDAEEDLADGSVSLGSSDLEMIQEANEQIVGIRFNGVSVPQGATIVKGWVQFQVDETTSIATNLTIQGEAVDNAVTFSSSALNISSRSRTSVETAVSWSPPPWETVGEAGPDQQTPDIATVIQEIVNRTGWSSGNSLVILVTGSGERTAESYNGDPAGAPLLHVEYIDTPASSPPVANDDTASTAVDTSVLIDVAANDTDADGNLDPGTTNTTCATCSGPSNGSLVNNGDGTFTYTPNPSFGGPDSFIYEICDTDSRCDTATVLIAVGTPPVANDDTASTAEDTPVLIDVAANDTDADGNLDPGTANTGCATCSSPANGSLANNGNGTFTYTPGPDYNGADSFVYEICDTVGACDTATVTVTVTPVSDPPVANDDTASTTEDTLVQIDVAANDTDADGNLDPGTTNTTCGSCSGPANGSLVNNGDGTFDYAPNLGYTGADSFVYEICDTGGLCDTATVTITVSSATHVLVGAGDIARCDEIDDDLTADLLDNIEGTVFTTGDNAYPTGSTADFNNCYDPTWGRHKARTRPSTGNHDYDDTNTGDAYFAYFGAAAGNPGEGWYSYDVGDWHIVVLNTNWRCNYVPCDAGSPQAQWLQADLAANPSTCTLAYWHYPRFATPSASGADGGPDPDYLDLWQILYDAGADLVLNGHRHIYERFAPQNPNGDLDPLNGIRQIIVGTGGGGGSFGTPIAANSEVRGDVPGVLKVTLHPTSYDWEFIPVAGETFTDSGSGTCSGATANQPPVANDDGYTTDEDTALNVAAPGVLGNDSDPESDPLTAMLDTGPANGSLTLNTDGSFEYTPDANFNGVDSFGYFANDGTVNSAITATVSITVAPVNDAPVANGDSATTSENTPVWIDVLANDTDVDGSLDTTSVTVTTAASNGTTNVDPVTGEITYTPNASYVGGDSFVYQVCDTGTPVLCDTATVTMTVTVTNDPPVANDDGYTTDEDTLLTVSAPGVLGNDTDGDGDPLTAVLETGSSNGSLTFNTEGSFSYTPDADFNGTDTFTYRANDGLVDSNVATVTITVNAVNDGPVAEDQSVSTDEDVAVGITLTASDVEGDPLTYSIVVGPSNGALSGTPPNVTYTPDGDYNGSDSFTFQANDGSADSNVATVSITVAAVNDAPVADDQSVSTDEDTAVGITLTASDVEGDPLTYSIVSGPTNGGLSGTPPSVTYTPNADFNGPDSLTFQANDGLADSNVATVSITVNPVNDAPVANDDSATTSVDTPVVVDVLANDTDVDGNLDRTAVTVTTAASNGTTSVDPVTGAITYTPNSSYVGGDSFVYQVCDTGTPVLCDTATVTMTVTASVTTWTFLPTDDAYVDSKKPTANHGSDSLLQVRAGPKELDSYLKFAVSGVGTVLEVKLRLWVLKDSPDGGSVYSVDNAWDEASLVWNNAPVIGGSALAAAGAAVSGTWVELDLTGTVTGDGVYSFALTSGMSNAVRYSSKEGGDPPELVITFQ
jgi:VCBS repeat-containing protein